jgi:uncharacterized membrane protein
MTKTTPAESQATPARRKNYFTPKRIARVSILVALSAVGAFIKLPSPTGTVALDSAPAFVAAAAFSPAEGAIVGVLGHMFSALITGFPLGLPIHILVALSMIIWVGLFGIVARKFNVWVAIPIGIILNGVGGASLLIPIYGFGIFAALVLPLVVGSAINIIIAVAVVKVLDRTGLGGDGGSKKSATPLEAPTPE